jgi:dTMP kinase
MRSSSVEDWAVHLITVEGIEGSGKSTLLAALSEQIRARGAEVIVTREPGGTAIGDAVRRIFLESEMAPVPLAEAMLVCAARAQHVAERIRPAIAAGVTVLCDRFTDSTLAYQGYGRGLDLGLLRRLCDDATGGLEPDLTFVLDLPVAQSRRRLAARNQRRDRLEREDEAFHERVRAGFLALAASGMRYHVLDAAQPPADLVACALDIIAAVRA